MILVDTSVWIDWFRTKRMRLEPESYRNFLTCGPVLQELLQGLEEGAPSEILRTRMLRIPRLEDPVAAEVFIEAAEIFRSGRRRGYTIRSAFDCLIAAIAIRHQVAVWHKDRDFDMIARFTTLRTITQFPS